VETAQSQSDEAFQAAIEDYRTWRLARQRAVEVDYVLAMSGDVCLDVFKPKKWLDATSINFPDILKLNYTASSPSVRRLCA
jgi:hypothetical protein